MPSPRVTSQKWSHFESLVQTTLRVFRWYLHTLYYNSQRPGTQRTVQFYISNATLKAYNQLILVQQGVNNQLLLLLLKRYSHVRLFVTPWTVAHQAPLSMGFSRHGYWSGLPGPPPRDLPNPGIEPTSLTSPALTGGFFTTSAPWEAHPQCHRGLFFRAGHGGAPTLRVHMISQVWTKRSPSPSTQKEMGQCL